MPFDVNTLSRPTVVEVVSPWCHECRAMEPSIKAVAGEYQQVVDLVTIDIASDPETARELGVKGTPTIIGFAGTEETFRHTGQLSLPQLEDLFGSLSRREKPTLRGGTDLVVRLGTGTILIALGLATGPSWILVAVGGAVLAFGLAPLLKWRG